MFGRRTRQLILVLAGLALLAPAAAAPAAPRAHAASSHSQVRRLQAALGMAADGVFGPQTERAVKRFQRRRGLTPDGVVGPATRAALGLGRGPVLRRRGRAVQRKLRRVRPAAAAPATGGRGVRALQRALRVPADGVYGPATERAVRRFQLAHGLTPDGVAGPSTRAALGLDPGATLAPRAGAGALRRLVAAADAIATKPYVYGGGHPHWRDKGYDCSGSLSYALHGAGLLDSPLDSTGFMTYGAPGPGRHVTIYANSEHTYMIVDGRRYDTSAMRQTGGSRWTSAPRSSKGFKVRHPLGL
jgi:cell wall-associated NlpC family hydrolase